MRNSTVTTKLFKNEDTPKTINNNIDQQFLLDLKFEIKEIQLRLKEETTNLDWIIFKMQSVGMNLEMRTYETLLNIYLNHFVCKYGLLNDINGKKLYLFSPLKSNKESNETKDLINVKVIITDRLNYRHTKENAPTSINIELGSFAFVFNLIAFKKIFEYIETLQQSFFRFESSQLTQADYEFLKKSNIGIEQKNDIPLLNDFQIKNLVKTSTKFQKSHDTFTNNLKINLTVDTFRLRFMTQKFNYYYLDLKNIEIMLLDTEVCSTINLLIKTGLLRDVEPNAIFSEILCLEEENNESFIHINVKIFSEPQKRTRSILEKRYNKEAYFFQKYLHPDSYDMSIKASVPKLRHILFYKHWDVFLVKFLKLFDF